MKSLAFALLILTTITASTQADVIPGLYNTGVDDLNGVLPGAATDTHYHVLESGTDAKVLSAPYSGLINNNSSSKWIWQNSTWSPTHVTLTFRTTFDLADLDPATANITGQWAVDNKGLDILINGLSTANTAAGYSSFYDFEISSGFIPGINTLDFIANDFGGAVGFRVQNIQGSAATAIPEPTSILLLTLGSALLFRSPKNRQP